MRSVALPDPIYDEAARRAAASGQTVEALVLDALSAYLADDEYAPLTPEQWAIIDQARADIAAGNFYTSEEVDERFVAKRAAWIREHTR